VGKQGIYAKDLSRELEALNASRHSTRAQYTNLAAATLALAGGLRAMDYAPTRAASKKPPTAGAGGVKTPPPKPIKRGAAKFGQDDDGVRYVEVTLDRSKWWNAAVTFVLHETGSDVDCYRWVRWAYLNGVGQGPDAFLFAQDELGMVPTVSADISKLCNRVKARQGNPDAKLSPHSLRVGTARALMLANVPRTILDGYLRWKSTAGDTYLQVAPKDFQQAMTPTAGQRSTELIFGKQALHRELGPTHKTW
jgi:hypothetical protein